VNEIYVTIAGRLVADPESRSTKGGVPFTAFRVASTVRRLNARTNQYEDAGTSFVNVTAFRSLGVNAAHSLHRGDPVVVHGRMRVNQWMRSDDTPATSVEVDAYTIGHDLSFGTTAFSKVVRAQVDSSDRMADPSVQSVHRSLDGFDPDTDAYEVEDAGEAEPVLDGSTEQEEQLTSV
jgi:single-strand DNA-binding protein